MDVSTVAASPGEEPRPVPRVAALTILAHPDPGRVGERVLLPALTSGRAVELSRLSPRFAQPGSGTARPLADPHLSRNPIRLEAGSGPGSVRIQAEAGGSSWEILGFPSPVEISAAGLERGAVLTLAGRVTLLLHLAPAAVPRETERFGLIGDSAAMAHLRAEIRRVADLGAPVLLRGETGTGKELVARAIHEAGPRRNQPYLALNLGAVPPALAASELFGAARGSFTGADRRREGYFERARGGTLFLDEIGEAPPEVQVLLLRTLESGEIQAVGAQAPQKVDVRILAATDADLETAVAEGRFRAPLLHRLNGYEIRLPPLVERRDDVGRLLVHFLRQELAAFGEEHLLGDPGPRGVPWLPARLVARLADHDWPGNVRELRNAARQIVVGSRGRPQAELPAAVERALSSTLQAKPAAPWPKREAPTARAAYRSPAEIGEEELLAALCDSRWNMTGAAARLGISRTSLYALVERCQGLRKAGELGPGEIVSALERSGGDLDAAAGELRVSPHGLRLRKTELGIG